MIRSSMLLPAVLVSAAMVLSAAMLSHAGPLDPPAGPISPSYKTLTEVEPRIAISATNTPGDAGNVFMITTPGSYYLADNLTAAPGRNGILITTSGVTIDLEGFTLSGGPGSKTGITAQNVQHVIIRNGSVAGWGEAGISIFSARNCLAENIRAVQNATFGISLQDRSIIRFCQAIGNGGTGIALGNDGIADSCSATENIFGIIGGGQALITGCFAARNQLGIVCDARSEIRRCTAELNTSDGIFAGSYCRIIENTCSLNGTNNGDGAGVHCTSNNNYIDGNMVSLADRGIDVDGFNNVIVRNRSTTNTVNYSIAGANIGLYVTGATTGAVNGSAGGASIGSTDPWVNLSY